MAEDRLPVFATRMHYKDIEARLRSARGGYELLKTKSSALQIQYRKLEERYSATSQNINSLFQRAYLLLSRAEFYGASTEVFRRRCARSGLRVQTSVDTVCGVVLPSFNIVRGQNAAGNMLSRGGAKLLEAKEAFDALLDLLVEIASVQNSFAILKSTLDATNRRVNALEHMLIPRLENTLHFISCELDEQERENFYRLKKIQGLNK